jgi:hypothetical protein
MDEIHELNSELYEALMDGSDDEVNTVIRNLNKVYTDIKKSLNDE